MLCMETITKVRRLFHKDRLSQREIAKKLQLDRRTVRKYLNSTEIPRYQRENYLSPKLGPFKACLIDRLEAQMLLPKHQRLSAVRHFEWLCNLGFEGKYPCVSRFIKRFYQEYQPIKPVFIPQSFPCGESYQFDWSHEKVCIQGEVIKLNVAHFRLCHSQAYFVRAYPRQTVEMLIDAHNHAFQFFGGTPQRGIYDNPKTIVKKIGRGKERIFNDAFLAMVNHFLIEPVACTPAAGWEKGQVERQVQTLRKRLFLPMLAFDSLDELNAYLLSKCQKRLEQPLKEDKHQTINERLIKEQRHFSAYIPYSGYRTERLLVNTCSLILFDSHRYSVPCHLVGKAVAAQITADTLRVFYGHEEVTQHPRSFLKNQITYNPYHYLSALAKKPGALRHGEPFIHWPLPECIKTLQKHLMSQPKGDKAMVKLLSLIADFGEDIGITAAEIALEQGIPTVEAVLNIILRLTEPAIPELESQHIPLTCPPIATLTHFDQLLARK
ncbi:IS21 family transposase [Providencia stuartii]|uniref:IS21 family transposase n=1 Tax=Providencia stuartii TaxID=588 RepID=UPI003AAF184B